MELGLEAQIKQDFFANTNRLNKIKRESNSSESNLEVAQEIESFFLQNLLKVMRESTKTIRSNLFASNAAEHYESMQDQQLAFVLAKEGGIGLSEMIVSQLNDLKARELTDADELSDSYSLKSKYYTLEEEVEEFDLSKKVQHNIQPMLKRTNLEALPDKEHSMQNRFITNIWYKVKQVASKLNLDPKLLAAQAALETGWGKLILKDSSGRSSYNLFNIKTNKSWQKDSLDLPVTEYIESRPVLKNASFKMYKNYSESIEDYCNTITNNKRYEKALAVSSNPEAFMQELAKAGFATDIKYPEKVLQVYQSQMLAQAIQANEQQSV